MPIAFDLFFSTPFSTVKQKTNPTCVALGSAQEQQHVHRESSYMQEHLGCGKGRRIRIGMSVQLPLAGEEEGEEAPNWVISLLEPTKQDFERNYIPWNILRTRKQVPAPLL